MIDLLTTARALHFASTATVTGAIFFQWLVAEPALREARADGTASVHALRRQLKIVVWFGLALVIFSGIAWIVALGIRITSEGLGATARIETLQLLLTGTRFGHVWIVRLALVIGLLALMLSGRQKGSGAGWRSVPAAIVAACLMGSLAWSGHAAGTLGVSGDVHRAADVLHVTACAAWLGGLLPLWLLLRCGLRRADPTFGLAISPAARRFSTLGVASVGTLLATGLINAWVLAGDLQRLLDTSYGELLALKIVLFLSMVAIAAYNRGSAVPRLPEPGAMRVLARNALVEAGLGFAILAIVGVLGVLPPAGHAGMTMR